MNVSHKISKGFLCFGLLAHTYMHSWCFLCESYKSEGPNSYCKSWAYISISYIFTVTQCLILAILNFCILTSKKWNNYEIMTNLYFFKKTNEYKLKWGQNHIIKHNVSTQYIGTKHWARFGLHQVNHSMGLASTQSGFAPVIFLTCCGHSQLITLHTFVRAEILLPAIFIYDITKQLLKYSIWRFSLFI